MRAESVNAVLSCSGIHVSAEGGCTIVSGVQCMRVIRTGQARYGLFRKRRPDSRWTKR